MFSNDNFHPLEVVIATATHSFKWVKITHICVIRYQTFANRYIQTHISFHTLAVVSRQVDPHLEVDMNSINL